MSLDQSISDVQYLSLPLYADSVETCPVNTATDCDGAAFACGMYQLDEKGDAKQEAQPQSRKGQINLYTVGKVGEEPVREPEGSGGVSTGPISVNLVDSVTNCPGGVLDMKWANSGTLGVAFSTGELGIYNVDVGSMNISKGGSANHRLTGGILLSLDWQHEHNTAVTTGAAPCNSSGGRLACTDSGGAVYLCHLSASSGVVDVEVSWPQAHQYEAWTCHYHNHTVYSGGDDSRLRAWDTRSPATATPIWASSLHDAGVCSILTHPTKEHLVLSGSYDEMIHMLDTRFVKHGAVSSVNVGGGVWRMKWQGRHIAAACMHSGFHVAALHSDDTLHEVSVFTGHESLAYGIDWLPLTDGNTNGEGIESNISPSSYLAACSFYDKKLSVWKWKVNNKT